MSCGGFRWDPKSTLFDRSLTMVIMLILTSFFDTMNCLDDRGYYFLIYHTHP